MSEIQQAYKTRAEAFAKFIQPGNYPVKKAQFYTDCIAKNMVQSDKTVLLVDLVSYVRRKFEIDPGNNQSMVDDSQAREKSAYELRKLKAETEAAERKGRKEDENWMEVVDHHQQMAAFAGAIIEALEQQTTLSLTKLIYICGGEISRAAEFSQSLTDLHTTALTDAVKDVVSEREFEVIDD